jgi:hypothetical protein
MSRQATRACSCAKRSAHAPPIPPAAPVTMTTCPAKRTDSTPARNSCCSNMVFPIRFRIGTLRIRVWIAASTNIGAARSRTYYVY